MKLMKLLTLLTLLALALAGCGGDSFEVPPSWRGNGDDPYGGVLLEVCGHAALQWPRLPVWLAVEDDDHRAVVEAATWVVEGQLGRDVFRTVPQEAVERGEDAVWMTQAVPAGGYSGRTHLAATPFAGCMASALSVEVDPALEGEEAVLVTAHELGHVLGLGHVEDGLMHRRAHVARLDERQLEALEVLLPRAAED